MHAPPGVTGGETLNRHAGQGLASPRQQTLLGGSRLLPNRLHRLRGLPWFDCWKAQLKAERQAFAPAAVHVSPHPRPLLLHQAGGGSWRGCQQRIYGNVLRGIAVLQICLLAAANELREVDPDCDVVVLEALQQPRSPVCCRFSNLLLKNAVRPVGRLVDVSDR